MTASPHSPFGAHVGFEVTEVASGRAKLAFDVEEHHHNTLGIVHGGVTSSIIDHAAGAAVISLGERGLTMRLEVEFLAPIRRGHVECEAHVDSRDDSRATVVATVTSEGRVCARGKVVFALRRSTAAD